GRPDPNRSNRRASRPHARELRRRKPRSSLPALPQPLRRADASRRHASPRAVARRDRRPVHLTVSTKIESIKLAKLKGYDKNARTHSAAQVAQLAAAITEFGF